MGRHQLAHLIGPFDDCQVCRRVQIDETGPRNASFVSLRMRPRDDPVLHAVNHECGSGYPTEPTAQLGVVQVGIPSDLGGYRLCLDEGTQQVERDGCGLPGLLPPSSA